MSPRKILLIGVGIAVAIIVVIGVVYGIGTALGIFGGVTLAGLGAVKSKERQQKAIEREKKTQQVLAEIEKDKEQAKKEARAETRAKAKLYREQQANYTPEQLRKAVLEELNDED